MFDCELEGRQHGSSRSSNVARQSVRNTALQSPKLWSTYQVVLNPCDKGSIHLALISLGWMVLKAENKIKERDLLCGVQSV